MIYTTGATAELCRLMLSDSAHIQEKDAEYLNKKRRRKNQEPIEPLYRATDVAACMEQFVSIPYGRDFHLLRNLRVRFSYAGHILGAASVAIDCFEGEKPIRVVFSGDIGRAAHPFLREPDPPHDADYLIMESTYGNRLHESEEDLKEKLRKLVQEVHDKKAKLIVPAFSVGRTQLIVWYLNMLWNEGKLPRLPIYVDSPLSTNATEIFRHRYDCFPHELRSVLLHDDDPFGFQSLTFIRDVAKSKELNNAKGPMMIISASGMCEAGRILHHLKNSITDPNNIVLIVGYQAAHTLGRRLLEKREQVKVFGDQYDLNCRVEVIDGFSAHGDQTDLMNYIKTVASGGRLKRVFLVHGEEKAFNTLKAKVGEELPNIEVTIPSPGQKVDISHA
jgi:metallo-beta-lactamase family protein